MHPIFFPRLPTHPIDVPKQRACGGLKFECRWIRELTSRQAEQRQLVADAVRSLCKEALQRACKLVRCGEMDEAVLALWEGGVR